VVQIIVDPSLTLTVPVGVLLPLERDTVAVNVTELPYIAGFVGELIEVDELTCVMEALNTMLTVTGSVPILTVQDESPDAHPDTFES
jgi:hypothetical protein